MARDSDYGDDMIVAVGEKLRAEYERNGITRPVRAGAIKERLGGGNHARIKRVWEAHLRGDAPEAAAAVQGDVLDLLPEEDRREVAEAISRLKGLVVNRVLGAKKAADEAAKREIDVVEAELRSLEVENERLTARHDELAAENGRLAGELADLEREVARLRQELQTSTQQAEATQVREREAAIALGAANEARDRAVEEARAAREEARLAREEAVGLRERAVAAESEARTLRAAAGFPAGNGTASPAPQAKRSGGRGRAAAE